ncbi:MAG: aminotransferase class III-fold pyridoxal phosphate-dependent enzyme, partial [Mesorhizobium sp.]
PSAAGLLGASQRRRRRLCPKRFLNGTYPLLFSTFGGNTVACAAGMAVLDVIERESLVRRSAEYRRISAA